MTGPGKSGPLYVLAFHHAGGTGSLFSSWQHALGSGVEVIPVRFPGRQRNGLSDRYTDMASLVHALADDLEPILSRRHMFYGHSMGAMVAYLLTRRRTAGAQLPPERLIVGAAAAPCRTNLLSQTAALSDIELAQWLIDVSGVPAEPLP